MKSETTKRIVRELLYLHFGVECDIAGESKVDALVSGERNFIALERGENLDKGQALIFIVGAIGFIDSVLSLTERFLRGYKGKELSLARKDHMDFLRHELKIPEHMDEETALTLCREVFDRKMRDGNS